MPINNNSRNIDTNKCSKKITNGCEKIVFSKLPDSEKWWEGLQSIS